MKTNFSKLAAFAAALAVVVVLGAGLAIATRVTPQSTLGKLAPTAPSALRALAPQAAKARDQPTPGLSAYLYAALGGMVSLASIALVLAIQQRRREALLQSPHLVTPENFRKWTDQVARAVYSISQVSEATAREISEARAGMTSSFSDMSRTFLTLQGALDHRDRQLQRAEQGWELQVFKKFLLRFARVDELLNDDNLADPNTTVSHARAMMRDALEECGVEYFSPAIGSDYRQEKGVGDQPLLCPIDDASLFFTIKNVLSPGYRVHMVDGAQIVVIPARVEVYVPQERENG